MNTGMKDLRFGDLYFAILISAWFAFVIVDIRPRLLFLFCVSPVCSLQMLDCLPVPPYPSQHCYPLLLSTLLINSILLNDRLRIRGV